MPAQCRKVNDVGDLIEKHEVVIELLYKTRRRLSYYTRHGYLLCRGLMPAQYWKVKEVGDLIEIHEGSD